MPIKIKNCLYVLVVLFLAVTITACGGGGGGDNNGDGTDGTGDINDGPNNLSAVCPTILEVSADNHVKYKSQNVHGGRGPSFILDCSRTAKQYWPISTYLATFPIYSVKGNEIGKFVVYDPGHLPYGNRSYSGLPGGYPPDSTTLVNSALAEGSTEIYVNVKDGICFKVNNPTIDQGGVTPLYGRGNGPC
jgi:hypothetical protein